MIDSLGFDTDRDLATLNREISVLTDRVDTGRFYSQEDRHNTWARLHNLRAEARTLAAQAAERDARTERLAAAILALGDFDLRFIAYVVFGPAALPVPSLYEVRVIERDGDYTVPGTVRRRVAAEQVPATERELLAEVTKRGGHAELWGHTIRDYRTQVTAY